MKMKNLCLFGLGALALASCKDKEEVKTTEEYSYVFGYRVQVDAENTADYLLMGKDLDKTSINADGKGIEQTGWNYYAGVGSNVMTMNTSSKELTSYNATKTGLTENGKLVFESIDMMANIPGNDEEILAVGAPWGGGSYDCNLQIIDAGTPSIVKSVKHPLYSVDYTFTPTGATKDTTVRLNAWPTGGFVDGDKLYVSFYPLEGASWVTPYTDTAYVSIFEYPSLAYVKTIKDTRTGPIGYYASQPCVLTDENGDHYLVSSTSYAAGYTTRNANSGILKIGAGAQDFDASYHFDVETVGGVKVLSAVYVGNGKAVAKVVDPAADLATGAGSWAAFSSTSPALSVVVLDLYAKTVTPVADVPVHGGQYATPFYVENGKAYFSANNGSEANIYEVDPTTATATKGAEIEGNEIQAIFKIK